MMTTPKATRLTLLLAVLTQACNSAPDATAPSALVVTKPTITAVDKTSPQALSVIHIATTGLKAGTTTVVRYANRAGFSATMAPLGIGTDGLVAVAVPLYVDSATGRSGAGVVSLSLIQGADTASGGTLQISDLPPVTSYGLALGDISHAYLNYLALRIARLINEVQAINLATGNTVDVSAEMRMLQTWLEQTVKARADVDQVSFNRGRNIKLGTLPSGTPVQFDSISLNMMDRVIAVYLTTLGPAISQAASQAAASRAAAHALRVNLGQRVVRRQTRTRRLPGVAGAPLPKLAFGSQVLKGSVASSSDLATILRTIKFVKNLTSVGKGIADATEDGQPGVAQLGALAGTGSGLTGLYGMAAAGSTSAAMATASAQLGALAAIVPLAYDMVIEGVDLWAYTFASDPITRSVAYDQLFATRRKAISDFPDAALSVFGPGVAAGTGAIAQFLRSNRGELDYQGAELLFGAVEIADSRGAFDQLKALSAQLASAIGKVFPLGGLPGLVEADGTANVTHIGNGDYLAALSGLAVGGFDVQNTYMTALADPAGGYTVMLPARAARTNYAAMLLRLFDPLSQLVLSVLTVDLSRLNPRSIWLLPPISGICIDDDYDGDDPDCD
jgi:hypothetical protein